MGYFFSISIGGEDNNPIAQHKFCYERDVLSEPIFVTRKKLEKPNY